MVTMTQLVLMMVKMIMTNPAPIVRVQCTLCDIIVQCTLCIPDPDLHRIAMQLLLVNMDRCND